MNNRAVWRKAVPCTREAVCWCRTLYLRERVPVENVDHSAEEKFDEATLLGAKILFQLAFQGRENGGNGAQLLFLTELQGVGGSRDLDCEFSVADASYSAAYFTGLLVGESGRTII